MENRNPGAYNRPYHSTIYRNKIEVVDHRGRKDLILLHLANNDVVNYDFNQFFDT